MLRLNVCAACARAYLGVGSQSGDQGPGCESTSAATLNLHDAAGSEQTITRRRCLAGKQAQANSGKSGNAATQQAARRESQINAPQGWMSSPTPDSDDRRGIRLQILTVAYQRFCET